MRALPSCRPAAVVLLCVGAIVSLAAPAGAAARSVVYPTGSYPADVQNVQAAVDRGGVVVLKAANAAGDPTAFNFGPPVVSGSGVDLTTDVNVQGETVNGHQTTIQGGFTPFRGFVPVKSRIAGITFDAPLSQAIVLLASTGTEIVGNHVDGVVGVRVRVPSGLVFTFGDGIDLFGDSGSISGSAKIAGNVIENLNSDFSIGIQLDEISAVTAITNNVVNFPVSNGFIENDGIDALRVHTPLTMAGNSVHLGPGSPDAFPLGFFIAGNGDASYQLTGNVVTSEHSNAAGIMVRGDIPGAFGPTNGAVIANNRILLASTTPFTAAMLLLEGVNNSQIDANTVVGTADYGFVVSWGALPSPADGNRFISNYLGQLTTSSADFFLDTNTSHTTVVGQCRTYVDLGTDNTIACVKPITAGAQFHAAPGLTSPQIRAAIRAVIPARR